MVHRRKTVHLPEASMVSARIPVLMREPIDAGGRRYSGDQRSIRILSQSKRLTFIGTNMCNSQAGQMSGELLVRELNGKGDVVLYSIPGQENLDERMEGLKRVLARNPGIKILQVVDMA